MRQLATKVALHTALFCLVAACVDRSTSPGSPAAPDRSTEVGDEEHFEAAISKRDQRAFGSCEFPSGESSETRETLKSMTARSPFHDRISILGLPRGDTVASAEETTRIICELRAAHLVSNGRGQWIPMRYDQVRNNCDNRAELAIPYLSVTHPSLMIGKVFVYGKSLSVFGEGVVWDFHVAPFAVAVKPGAGKYIAVLDPALSAVRALSLDEWLAAVQGSGAIETVFLTEPQVWSFDKQAGKPQAPAASKEAFCANVATAGGYLAEFESGAPRIMTRLPDVQVKGVTETGLVTFTNGRRDFGPYGVREELSATLRAAATRHFTVCRQRQYGGNAFTNAKYWLLDKREVVYFVRDRIGPDGGIDRAPCPSPISRAALPATCQAAD